MGETGEIGILPAGQFEPNDTLHRMAAGLGDCLARAVTPDGVNRDALSDLANAIRQIAISGRRGGYRRVAELASIAEVMLDPIVQDAEPVTREFRGSFSHYIHEIVALAERGPDEPPEPEATLERRVLLVDSDVDTEAVLGAELDHFGFDLEHVLPVRDSAAEHTEPAPGAIIVDLDRRDAAGCAAIVEDIVARHGPDVPLIALSSHDHLWQRLIAVRAGFLHYFTKPVEPYALVDRLDELWRAEEAPPLRIVLVEDSPTQRRLIADVLTSAGMTVTALAEPDRLLEVLDEASPDLLLLDMYLSGCNGLELARVIRQVPAYVGVPIVFLSAEQQRGRQLDAMSGGGDDFLTKPVDRESLVRSVRIRADRARALHALMASDTLTGLLNHTSLKELLWHEVARAQRIRAPLAFAMLDIDMFKDVNDRHGHAVGDRVIKTLARLLRQRLRRSDGIGRHGGEEFSVILPGAGAEEARNVLDAVRQTFSRIRHRTPDGDIRVTFSGGIAAFPAVGNPADLVRAADQALYRAKRAGRNCLMDGSPGKRD